VKRMPFADRFWSKVDKRGPNDCWEWTAYRHPQGYGLIRHGGRDQRAHRVALELALGEDLGPRWALHRCDNPPCCNPAHLYAGSRAENIADAVERHRYADITGPANPRARFTSDQVAAIRDQYRSGASIHALAREHGISRPSMRDIVRNVSYRVAS
jgi:hypothetical protein